MRRLATRRSLAVVTVLTTGLVALGLSVPASASPVAITDINNPVNQTDDAGVVMLAGTGTPGDILDVCVSGLLKTTGVRTEQCNDPVPPTAVDPMGAWTAQIDANDFQDGVIRAIVRSNQTLPGDPQDEAFKDTEKDTSPPGVPTNLAITPAPINASNVKAIQLCGTKGSDTDSVELKLAGTTGTPLVQYPAGSNGVFCATFDTTTLPDGTITGTVTAIDDNFNKTSATTTTTKDATAPTAPTFTTVAGTTAGPGGGTANKVSNASPGKPSGTVDVTLTNNEASTDVLTVTDSAAKTLSFPSSSTAATSQLIKFNPYQFSDGQLTLVATATDAAGNPGPSSTYLLTLDTSNPEVVNLTITPSPINNAGKANVRVSGSVVRTQGSSAPSEAGTTVTLTRVCTGQTNQTVANVATAADGSFSTTFDVTNCPDGANSVQFQAFATDPSNNKGATASVTATKDVSAPTVLNLTATAIIPSSTSSTVSGTTEAGATVKVTLSDGKGGTSIGTTTANGVGSFTVAVDGLSLADGTITVTANATDAAGNTGANATTTTKKDTTQFAFVSSTPTGTAAPSTTVTGTFNEVLDLVGSSIALRNAINAPISGNTSFSADGKTIIFKPTGNLADGTYTATITGKDSGPDNDAPVTVVKTFTVDSTAPAAPTLSTITNPVNNANKAAVHVTGTAEANADVTITITDSTLPTALTATGSAKAGPTGAFDVTVDTTALKDGALSATGKASDGANTSVASAPITTTKDTVAPSVTNVNATDTTQAQPKTTVTATSSEVGNAVTVTLTDSANGTVTATTTSGANGAISVQVDASSLKDGLITVSVVAKDAAGNPSTPGTKQFTKDATGPTISGLAATKVISSSSGKTTVTGSLGEAGTVTLTVSDGTSSVAGSGTAASGGAFSVTVDVSALKDGTLTVTATGKDSKGNSGAPATATTTKDTVKPVVTNLAATATTSKVQTTTVTGKTEPGASVAITVTDGSKFANQTVTSDSQGSFSADLDLTGFASGSLPVTARATDAAGNVGDPATTTSARDANGPVITGLAATAVTKAKTSTTVTGTVDDKNATVALKATDKNGLAKTGTATVATDGSFSGTLDLTSLADGPITVTAAGTDSAGNTGSTATATTTKDTTAPAVSGLAATNVNSAKTSTNVTGNVDDATATVALKATDKNGLTKTGTATVASGGSFTGSLDLSTFADGSVTVSATPTDPAGNAGSPASLTINKDATNPVVSGLTATASTKGKPASTVSGSVDDKAATVALEATDVNGKKVTGTAPVNASTGAFTASLDLSSLADGTVTVKATATDAAGNTGTATVSTTRSSAPAPGTFQALTPDRLLDTRKGTGAAKAAPVSPGGTLVLKVTGRGGVPSANVSAVVLNVTVTAPTAGGSLTVYPTGATRPEASNLNFGKGQTVPNAVVVPVAQDGTISLFNNSAGSTHLLADVAGWFVGGSAIPEGGFKAVTPSRVLDTRTGNGAAKAPVSPGGTLTLKVTGRGGVPSANVSAVVLNVTVTAPTSAGSLTVYPTGATRPETSNLNFGKGQTVPNLVVVPVAQDGTVQVYNGSNGSTHVIGDVAGFYYGGTPVEPGTFATLTPKRVLDTRDGVGAPDAAVASNDEVVLQVLGKGGIPSSGVRAVVLNVTVTAPTSPGSITVYPTGATRPETSNLNFGKGRTVPNLVVVPVGSDGTVRLYNGSTGTVQLIADVAGYYRS